MKLLRLKTSVRHYAHVLLISGPVGLVFAVRLALLERSQRAVANHIELEKELHRDHMAALKHEQTTLVENKQRLVWAATAYWEGIQRRQLERRLRDIVAGDKS